MSDNFNYIDAMNSSTNLQFIADQHDHAVETTGRKCYIFLLDKEETVKSDVYGEETHGRIYLPHYEQRAIYKTNQFVSQLGVDIYSEKESALAIEFDFGRMVYNINKLKTEGCGKLTITNKSKIPLFIEVSTKSLLVRNFSEVLFEKKLEGNVFKFIHDVNNETSLIHLDYVGDSDTLDFLDVANFKLLPRRNKELLLNNSIYKNVPDVITNGAAILTDRMRLYQVVSALPKDDSYGRYITWVCQLQLMNLAKADGLPNDYAEIIKRNQYGLGSRYNLGGKYD